MAASSNASESPPQLSSTEMFDVKWKGRQEALINSEISSQKAVLKQLSASWQQGQLSNFDYLMRLNALAGRTYNDLTQYPVFPWVLTDYLSDHLKLNDPSIFRDLSRPMGALSEPRAEKFRQRYHDWDDPVVPKFHYGTHYSSAAVVLYYLIRLEPLTQHLLQLQSGRFDKPDRLFHSIQESWRSASMMGGAADVKELIPEFFYFPEFLQNGNQLDLGWRQNGACVADVILPTWAHGCVRNFVRLHRRALESTHVSAHLHHWIDLIFGNKQQGSAAAEAQNVFYYVTYEGQVDIDSITDPLMKAATIEQIRSFGQTPVSCRCC
jgi:hypothetical protein